MSALPAHEPDEPAHVDLGGSGPFAASSPAEIRAAIIEEDVPAFDEQWRQVMTEAAKGLDLTPVIQMLNHWRLTAWVQQDREAYARMTDAAARLLAGEDVPTVPWEHVRARLGI